MVLDKLPVDNLTGLYHFIRYDYNNQNKEYILFAKMIDNYLKQYNNSNYIMIDLQKFKNINDTYGHEEGDNVLKFFAKLLVKYFDNSIITRFGGDEFSIITKYNSKEINNKFKKIMLEIKEETKKDLNDKTRNLKQLKESFYFNAGSFSIVHSLNEAFIKADKMMYYAKNNNLYYQEYQENIWNKLKEIDEYNNKLNNSLDSKEITYIKKDIYDLNFNNTNIIEIHSYTSDKNDLSTKENYRILRKQKNNLKLDYMNINYILKNLDNLKINTIFIDYITLLDQKVLFNIKELLSNKNSKIILSINLDNINSLDYYNLIKVINDLKQQGILIRIDNFSDKVSDYILNNSEIDYISFDQDYLDNLNERSIISFKYKLLILNSLGIKIIFNSLNENLNDLITNLNLKNIYLKDQNYNIIKRKI